MTDEKDPHRCPYICPRKQRQCKMLPSSPLSAYCMEHVLHDPNLDEVKYRLGINRSICITAMQ
jgi:hypothetical protein